MADNTLNFLDDYCERSGLAGFGAEPINTYSNIAFLIAAILLAIRWYNHPRYSVKNSLDIMLLIATIGAISVGSGLWHAYATRTYLLADVIPIAIFMNAFLLVYMIRVLQLKPLLALVLWIIFQAVTITSEVFLPASTLNGTIMYVPAYCSLLLLLWASKQQRITTYHYMLWATLLWSLSLVARTIDLEVCMHIQIGTHFLWHILNACVLYFLTLAIIKSR